MKITPDDNNFRKHDKRNKDAIDRSLSQCGAGRSILVDRDGMIIAGNGVYNQAMKVGIPIKTVETDGTELVAVVRTDIGTQDKKRRDLALFDNSTSDLSGWNYQKLQNELSAFELENVDIEIPNFSLGSGFGESTKDEIEISPMFPIEVMANQEDYDQFNQLKEKYGFKRDIDLVRFFIKDNRND